MGFEFGRHPIADNTSRTKHVVAAGSWARDGGSTPPASTIVYRSFVIVVDLTVQIRGNPGMKTKPVSPTKGPLEVVKLGSISIPIYATTNRIYRVNPAGGKRELKSQHPQFTVIYYEGSRRVKRKFADLEKARREADLAGIKLSNGEAEILKLTGTDRADYVHPMRHLHGWNESAHLNLAVTDYVAATKRLPVSTSLKEAVDFYLKRHPIGFAAKISSGSRGRTR